MKIGITLSINRVLYTDAKTYHDSQWARRSNVTHINGIKLADDFMSRDVIDMRDGTYKYFGDDLGVYICHADDEVELNIDLSLIEYAIVLVRTWYRKVRERIAK